MKPKATLRHFLAAISGATLALSSASATTYTWTQTATGNQDWTTAGNWSGSTQFVSGASNELRFFADTNAQPATGQVVINLPASLSMNTLTLNGKGPNSTAGSSITIGTSASTWTLGDGTTSTVNLNSVLGGGTTDRDLRYTIAANLALTGGTGGITTFTGNSTSGTGAVFSGNISENSTGQGITKTGASVLVFSGNNTYTGTTSITGGVLRLASANALNGGTGTTGGLSALTLNGGSLELGAGNFSRDLGTGSSQFQITGGTSGFSAFGGPRVVTVNGDASQELQWGSATFAPTTLVLNAASANNSIELTNKIDLNGATRTVQVNANKALLSNVIRTASGTGNLTKTGNGTLVLTGNNTYNGTTTINGGTLSIDSVNNIGGGTANLTITTGTLQIRGTTLTDLSQLDTTVSMANNNAKGFDVHNAANTFTVDQVISGSGAVTKGGLGTLILNQANTHTGTTTMTGGGTLVLDYGSGQNNSKIGNAALTLSGGNLVLRGGSHAQAVTSIVLGDNTGNSVSRDGGSSTLANTGTLDMRTQNSGGVTSVSNLAISEGGIVATTTANTNGIIGLGQATVGSHFATNASNVLQAYGGYVNYTAGAGGGSSTTVNQLTGGGSMSGTLTSHALRIVNDGNSNVLNLGANNLTVANLGTILYAGGVDDNYTINGTGALRTVSTNQFLNINTYTGTLTVNAVLTAAGTSRLYKAGAGTLVAGGASAYTGPTYVQQGVLRLANNSAAGTGSIIVQGGAALELSQTTGGTPTDISIGAQALALDGTGISNNGALRNHSGNNTYGGLITIGTSGARINANNGTSLTLTGGVVTTLTQDVTFGGAGNTTVSTTAISGSGSLIKDGLGTLTLSAANTYTGATTVTTGTLIVNGNISTSVLTTVNAGATLGGAGTVGATTINGVLAPGNSIGTLNATGDVTWNDNDAWVFELGSAASTLALANTTPGLSDLLNITGGNDFLKGTGSSFTFNFAGGGMTGWYKLVDWSGTTDFVASNFFATNLDTGLTATFTVDGGTSALYMNVVPEPRAALLGGLGLLMLLRRRRE